MLTAKKFYGDAIHIGTLGTIFGVPQRVLDVTGVSGATGLTLPSRAGLHPGGPYWYLLNRSGGGIPLKRETGATLLTMGANTITTVLLSTSKWVAYSKTKNGVRTFGSNHSLRTQPVGYQLPSVGNVNPISYNGISCSGGYRRARFCDGGAKANIWMLDTDIAAHFVGGVASMRYMGQCLYFKQSDSLLVGHGTLVASGDVSAWYATCDLCMADYCVDNPLWPRALSVKITDPTHSLPTDYLFYLGGIRTLTKTVGGSSYECLTLITDNGGTPGCWAFSASLICTPTVNINTGITETGWFFKGATTGEPCGSPNAFAIAVHRNPIRPVNGPPIGIYSPDWWDTGSDFGGIEFWPGLVVEVLGYL